MTGDSIRPTFVHDDGGRAAAGRRTNQDCVTRAIATMTGRAYLDVYRDLHARQKAWARSKGYKAHRESPRNGCYDAVWKPYLQDLGYTFTAERRLHNLPRDGRYIVEMLRHLTVVDDWVCRDTWDCFSPRRGKRIRFVCIEGFWTAPADVAVEAPAGQLALFAA